MRNKNYTFRFVFCLTPIVSKLIEAVGTPTEQKLARTVFSGPSESKRMHVAHGYRFDNDAITCCLRKAMDLSYLLMRILISKS